MNEIDLNAAIDFFRKRLRGVETATLAQLRRWALHKLRNDAQATAELMISEGYRATYIKYFVVHHIQHIDDYSADSAISVVVSDLQRASRKLPQPYRDLADVCFKWGYAHNTVINLLERKLRDGNAEHQPQERRPFCDPRPAAAELGATSKTVPDEQS